MPCTVRSKPRSACSSNDVGLFADGTAVKLAGEETFRICKKYVDEIVLVDTDAVCAAIKDVFQDTRSILEPAGALAIAGAKLYAKREQLKGETLVTICQRREHELRPPAFRRRTRRDR